MKTTTKTLLAALLVTGLSTGPAHAAPAPAVSKPASPPAARPAPVAAPTLPTIFMNLEQARTLEAGALVIGSNGLDVRYGALENLELLGQTTWNPGFQLGQASSLTGGITMRLGAKYRLIDQDSWSLAAQGSLTATSGGGTIFQAALPVTWNVESGRAFHLAPNLLFGGATPMFSLGVGFEQVLNPVVRIILANQTFNAKVGTTDQIKSTFEGGLRFTLGPSWTVDATLATADMVLSPFTLEAGATVVGLRAWYGLPSWGALRQALGA